MRKYVVKQHFYAVVCMHFRVRGYGKRVCVCVGARSSVYARAYCIMDLCKVYFSLPHGVYVCVFVDVALNETGI